MRQHHQLRAARHLDIAGASAALDSALASRHRPRPRRLPRDRTPAPRAATRSPSTLAERGVAVRRFPRRAPRRHPGPRPDRCRARSRRAARGAMRTLELPAGKSPREWGLVHGESFRGEIQALAAIRVVPVHQGRRLQERRPGARPPRVPTSRCSSAITVACTTSCSASPTARPPRPNEIVVANHYTDLRDLDPDPARWQPAPTRDAPEAGRAGQGADGLGGDGCSVLVVGIADRSHPRADLGHARDRDPVRDGAARSRDRRRARRDVAHRDRLPRHGRDEQRARRDRDQQPVLDRRDARRGVAGDGAPRTPRAATRRAHAT